MTGLWPMLLLVVGIVAMAGCANDDEGGSRVEVEYGGVSVRATDTTGIIRGFVVDEAIRPLANVTVTLTGRDRSTTTSAAGSFGFSDLAPGAYYVEASSADFETAQAYSEVVAGVDDPPLVKIQLTKLPSKAPYFQSQKFDVFYVFGAGVGGQSLGTSVTGTNPVTQSPYYFQVNISPNSTHIQAEARWEPTQALAEGAWVTLLAFDQDFEVVEATNAFSSSPNVVWVNGTVEGRTATTVDGRIYPGMSQGTPAAVFANQPFVFYLHTFYNFRPAPDWSFGEHGDPTIPPTMRVVFP